MVEIFFYLFFIDKLIGEFYSYGIIDLLGNIELFRSINAGSFFHYRSMSSFSRI